MTDRIRVLRIIEYVGPREWVEKTVANSIHGTKVIRPTFNPDRIEDKDVRVESQITAVTLGEFGESIADSIREPAEWVSSGIVNPDRTHRTTSRNPIYFDRRGPTQCRMCGVEGVYVRKVRRWLPAVGATETFLVCERCETGMMSTLPGYDHKEPEVVPFQKKEGLE